MKNSLVSSVVIAALLIALNSGFGEADSVRVTTVKPTSAAPNKANANRQSKIDASSSSQLPASSRQVAPLFRLPNHQLDSTYNPILLYWGWGLIFYFFLPGLAAIALGFVYPFYEYLRTGHTYYHPGMLWDKDFSEYTTWYFKHKIYKKKYWNLDAYLYHYFQSNNDNLRNFYHEMDAPLNKLVAGGFKEKAEDLLGGDSAKLNAVAGELGKEASGSGQSNSQGGSDPGAGKQSMEEIMRGLLLDMMENNPEIKKYIEKDVEGKGYEKIKSTLMKVILEEYASKSAGSNAGVKEAGKQETDAAGELSTLLHGKPSVDSASHEVPVVEPTAYAQYYADLGKSQPKTSEETAKSTVNKEKNDIRRADSDDRASSKQSQYGRPNKFESSKNGGVGDQGGYPRPVESAFDVSSNIIPDSRSLFRSRMGAAAPSEGAGGVARSDLVVSATDTVHEEQKEKMGGSEPQLRTQLTNKGIISPTELIDTRQANNPSSGWKGKIVADPWLAVLNDDNKEPLHVGPEPHHAVRTRQFA